MTTQEKKLKKYLVITSKALAELATEIGVYGMQKIGAGMLYKAASFDYLNDNK